MRDRPPVGYEVAVAGTIDADLLAELCRTARCEHRTATVLVLRVPRCTSADEVVRSLGGLRRVPLLVRRLALPPDAATTSG